MMSSDMTFWFDLVSLSLFVTMVIFITHISFDQRLFNISFTMLSTLLLSFAALWFVLWHQVVLITEYLQQFNLQQPSGRDLK